MKTSNPLSVTTDNHIVRLLAAILVVASFAVVTFLALERGSSFSSSAQGKAGQLDPEAARQIALILDEKNRRTPAQQKIDSNLLYRYRMARNEPAVEGLADLQSSVATDAEGFVDVDIVADVSDELVSFLKKRGAEIVAVLPQYRSIVARVPIQTVEMIAGRSDVIFVQPKHDSQNNSFRAEPQKFSLPVERGVNSNFAEPTTTDNSFATRAQRVSSFLKQNLSSSAVMVGSATAQSDKTHRTEAARVIANVNGAGLKIGVMSNGVNTLAARQASGDLPTVTVLAGQAGTGDEGTAMLEIVHDIAPGAQLFYATASTGITIMAQNIRDLRTAGCDIIIDDISYFVETPFQDGQAPALVSNTNQGVVIQAVNDVTTGGAMYFSSAANSGNKNDNTAGVWEGDFVDGGASTAPLPLGGTVHNFGGGTTFNTYILGGRTTLKWSDPIGGSANDYDLFVLNAAGTTVSLSSTNVQSGTQDPSEDAGTAVTGARAVIFRKAGGQARFLHLNTNRGLLNFSTSGVTYGHNSGRKTISVAATPAGPTLFNSSSPLGPFPFGHSAANTVELFSSDGPRRVFYNADGTAITPGNVSSTGGELLQKPDVTAADGVTTTTPGFIPFFGTSAAAPQAGAMMALLKQASPGSTNAQLINAMNSTAIDIEQAGVDRDSGSGIFMPLPAMASLGVAGPAAFEILPATSELQGNGNGAIDPGETIALSVPLTNIGLSNATGVTATISTSTPLVTINPSPTRSYPNIAAVNGTGNSATPFSFTLGSTFPCGGTIAFSISISYAGSPTPLVQSFTVQAAGSTTLNETLDTTAPTSGANYTAVTGTQLNRLNRNGITSSCAAPKTAPPLQEAAPGTSKRFDSYTFTASTTGCVTVTINPSNATALFSAAYLTSFDPNAIQTNYLADYGVTTAGTLSYSFNVTAGQQFVVVIHEVATGGGIGVNYALNVSGPIQGGCSPFVSAANVQIGGRVTAASRGVANAVVQITDGSSFTRTARTSSFGYYSFENVPASVQYTVSASAKRYTFNSQQITPATNNLNLNFTANP